MKRTIICLLILSFLLAGCISQQPPETTAPSSAESTTQVPTVPTTAPTTEATWEPSIEVTTEPTTEPTVALTLPEQILQSMTTEEKVGQLFLARCPDVNAAADAAAYHLGGYVLFGRDFDDKTPEDVIADIASYQEAADIPLLIAVDEEGGTVCRVSSHKAFRSSRFRSPRSLYKEGGLELVLETEKEKCLLLSSLGINVNLAPVCDVTTDPDAFMYSRSLGQSPETTGEFVAAMVECMAQHSIGGVLKHFPGYGNNTDTHTGVAVDERSLEELEAADLLPFAQGIAAGADAIMITHTFINSLDPSLPASLSPDVIAYLRGEMAFEGVTITDDLAMQAITNLYGDGEAAVLAVLAGNSMLCSSEYKIQYQAVLEAVQSGRISEELLDDAVLRVLNWKYELGLLEQLYITPQD